MKARSEGHKGEEFNSLTRPTAILKVRELAMARYSGPGMASRIMASSILAAQLGPPHTCILGG